MLNVTHPLSLYPKVDMLTSVIITNYNYGAFLDEAVASVLAQTHGDIEIILVDDGSTDNSSQVIEELAKAHKNIVPHYKPNGGQLSAFNAGFRLARGEVLFFLDADDLYRPDYLAKALSVYSEHPNCDFLYCAFEAFGTINRQELEPFADLVTDVGYSGLLTYYDRTWIGGPTSALSLRRSLAEKFFPIADERDWRIRADDCLVWLASLYNGRKFYLKEPLVAYRTHDNNNYHGKERDAAIKYLYSINRAKLFAAAAERMKHYTTLRGNELAALLLQEAAIGQKGKYLDAYRTALKRIPGLSALARWRYRRRLKRIIKRQKKLGL